MSLRNQFRCFGISTDEEDDLAHEQEDAVSEELETGRELWMPPMWAQDTLGVFGV